MLRLALLVVALAGCRFHFDSLTTSDDGGPEDGPSDTVGDATMVDAMQTPLVQAAQLDAATGGFTMTNANSGLVPVTPGNMVFVVCGHPTASGQCLPTSTPA